MAKLYPSTTNSISRSVNAFDSRRLLIHLARKKPTPRATVSSSMGCFVSSFDSSGQKQLSRMISNGHYLRTYGSMERIDLGLLYIVVWRVMEMKPLRALLRF
jgi:hypothetical protein